MKQLITLTVNGEPHEVMIEPAATLLDVLRDVLGLTGAKKGCETGNCGSCTVLVDGAPVASCLLLAVEAQGKDILTIEGLAKNGILHPCGFCTPGMILTTKALLDKNPQPSREEIKVALAGNLCRCTGYARIFEAVEQAAAKMQGVGK